VGSCRDLVNEFKNVLGIGQEDIAKTLRGRVYFQYNFTEETDMDRLQDLKSVERLYYVVARGKLSAEVNFSMLEKEILENEDESNLSNGSFEARLAEHITNRCLESEQARQRLVSALQLWRHFQPGKRAAATFKIFHSNIQSKVLPKMLSGPKLVAELAGVFLDRNTLTTALRNTRASNGSSVFVDEVCVDVKNPDLKFCLQYSQEWDEFHLAVLILKASATMSPLQLVGLPMHVCWGIAKTANIRDDDVVLDPMCGKGTLLVVAADSWGNSSQKFVGWDESDKQIEDFHANLRQRNGIVKATGRSTKENQTMLDKSLQTRFYVERTDAALKKRSVAFFDQRDLKANVVLCDLPYGRLYGSLEGNKKLYPEFCQLLVNTLHKDDGRFVLITSSQNVQLLTRSLLQFKQDLVIVERRNLTLGTANRVLGVCIFSGRIRSKGENSRKALYLTFRSNFHGSQQRDVKIGGCRKINCVDSLRLADK